MDAIYNLFKDRKPDIIGRFGKSAVMLLLADKRDNPSIIFEVRSLELVHQPGDICLPGGKIEIGESPKTAAIRETMEELNLKRTDIDFIGSMDYLITPFNFIIFPYVSRLTKKSDINPNKAEVDHIFKVPLKFFMDIDPEKYEIPLIQQFDKEFPYELINNGKNYQFRQGKVVDYFYKYKDYAIWGFTARIIKRFVDILRSEGNFNF